jgi:hypothetical protein
MDTSALGDLEGPDRNHGRRTRTLAWAAGALQRHGMPPGEIAAVVSADDPEVVRRHLALHRERMEERLTEAERALSAIESFLARSARRRRRLPDVNVPMRSA